MVPATPGMMWRYRGEQRWRQSGTPLCSHTIPFFAFHSFSLPRKAVAEYSMCVDGRWYQWWLRADASILLHSRQLWPVDCQSSETSVVRNFSPLAPKLQSSSVIMPLPLKVGQITKQWSLWIVANILWKQKLKNKGALCHLVGARCGNVRVIDAKVLL